MVTPFRAEEASPESSTYSKSLSNIWCCLSKSLDSQIQESRGRNGSGTTHYYSSDPLATFLLPVPTTLHSADLELMISEGEMLPPGDTTIELKVQPATQTFGFLMPLNQQAKKGVTVLAGVLDPDYQGEIRLSFCSKGKEENV